MFPARAGMSRRIAVSVTVRPRVPRASGDEPRVERFLIFYNVCSPRERG